MNGMKRHNTTSDSIVKKWWKTLPTLALTLITLACSSIAADSREFKQKKLSFQKLKHKKLSSQMTIHNLQPLPRLKHKQNRHHQKLQETTSWSMEHPLVQEFPSTLLWPKTSALHLLWIGMQRKKSSSPKCSTRSQVMRSLRARKAKIWKQLGYKTQMSSRYSSWNLRIKDWS